MKKIEFIKPVYNLTELPKQNLPTVVLCGRSNVGKSSFINSLFNTKLAKTSSHPGKTRSINYYLVENKFFLVDLPGFGYAKVSKSERDAWQHLLEKYFSLNKNIDLAVHIIDSRHDPMQLDIELNEFLHEQNIPYFIILNKSDKLKQSELASARKQITKFFPELIYGENMLFYSTIKGTGKKEVVKLLTSLFLI
ncbi:MAG: YihA family ribosome biogenesis GTP-binding protein [Ignavibacteriales bacterium]|nr:MAG: YihA family ribosome biogenesis GTP-binding protein [Ignavibacteriales bacterium]